MSEKEDDSQCPHISFEIDEATEGYSEKMVVIMMNCQIYLVIKKMNIVQRVMVRLIETLLRVYMHALLKVKKVNLISSK